MQQEQKDFDLAVADSVGDVLKIEPTIKEELLRDCGEPLPLFSKDEPSKERNQYVEPLTSRYASQEMSFNFSAQKKFSTWRRLWIALAECQRNLGLQISKEAIKQMKENVDNIDFEQADRDEITTKHDVAAHIRTYARVAPKAARIIHLGATSAFVVDNADLIVMRDGLALLKRKLLRLIQVLAVFADERKSLPTLGRTHLQPAQVTTVGKRAAMWCVNFVMDVEALHALCINLPLRGTKGTVGTEASFLELFAGDFGKVKKLNSSLCLRMGFLKSVPVCGQTYTRKIDYSIMSALSAISQSASKMCADIRLLAGFKELEEPFGVGQVGSSAMPYKRNPILCERVCGLARFVIEMPATLAHTQANQWLERSLDDSAVRRVVIPEAFIAADVILNTCVQICDGLVVWPAVIKRNLYAELPFMAAEVIIVSCVKAGESRQVIHEALRVHSAEAARRIKESGDDNILFELLAADPLFASVHNHFASFCDAKLFMGTAPKQVEDFMSDIVVPLLKEHAKDLDMCVIDV